MFVHYSNERNRVTVKTLVQDALIILLISEMLAHYSQDRDKPAGKTRVQGALIIILISDIFANYSKDHPDQQELRQLLQGVGQDGRQDERAGRTRIVQNSKNFANYSKEWDRTAVKTSAQGALVSS